MAPISTAGHGAKDILATSIKKPRVLGSRDNRNTIEQDRAGHRCEQSPSSERRRAAALVLLNVFLLGRRGPAKDEPGPEAPSRKRSRSRKHRLDRSHLPNGKKRPHDTVLEADNLTFRPTVLVRRGTSQGSGTIIASIDARNAGTHRVSRGSRDRTDPGGATPV